MTKENLMKKSIFTSFSLERGKIGFKELHRKRLVQSFRWAQNISDTKNFEEKLDNAFEKLELEEESAWIRINIFPKFEVLKRELVRNKDEVFLKTANKKLREKSRPDFLKIDDYELANGELERAKEKDFNEVLFFNEDDKACECSTSNIFFLINGIWKTPKVNSLVLNGVVREKIIELFKKQETSFLECELSSAEAKEAEAIFITNSKNYIRPVKKWDDRYYNLEQVRVVEKEFIGEYFG